MSDPFIAEIRIFAGNFAPRSWAFCDGQLLPISQNTALFSLIGTTYGGDGRTTTGLPNLKGRAPMHPGTGPGLTQRRLGERSGSETATLTSNQLPSHNHGLGATVSPASTFSPGVNSVLARSIGAAAFDDTNTNNALLNTATLPSVGASQAHNNLQPFLTLNYIIALVGSYPSRS